MWTKWALTEIFFVNLFHILMVIRSSILIWCFCVSPSITHSHTVPLPVSVRNSETSRGTVSQIRDQWSLCTSCSGLRALALTVTNISSVLRSVWLSEAGDKLQICVATVLISSWSRRTMFFCLGTMSSTMLYLCLSGWQFGAALFELCKTYAKKPGLLGRFVSDLCVGNVKLSRCM